MPASARRWRTACRCTRPAPTACRTCVARARAIHTHGPVSGAFRGFGVPQAAIGAGDADRPAGRRGRHRPARVPACGTRFATATPPPPASALRRSGSATASRRCEPPLARGRWPRPRRSTPATARSGAASGSRPAGTAAATPRCPIPRPSASGCAATARSCCTRARPTSARARPRSSPRSPPTRSGCRSRAFTLVGGDTALTPDAGKTSASRQTYVSGKAVERAAREPARDDPAPRQRAEPAPRWRSTGARLLVERRARRSSSRRCRPTPRGYVFAAEETLRPADHAARRRRPGRALRGLRLRRAARGARGRHARSAR